MNELNVSSSDRPCDGAHQGTLVELGRKWEERCKLKKIAEEFTTQDVADALYLVRDLIPGSQLETLTKGIDVINAVENYSRMNNVPFLRMIMMLVHQIGNGRLIQKVSMITGEQEQQPTQSTQCLLEERPPCTQQHKTSAIKHDADDRVGEVGMPIEETGTQSSNSQPVIFQGTSAGQSSTSSAEIPAHELKSLVLKANVDSMFESVATQLRSDDYASKGRAIDTIRKLVNDNSAQLEGQLRLMLGAEGPTISLQLKFETYMLEKPFRHLPHLLAGAGHLDNLAWYCSVFGSEKVREQHEDDFWLPLDWAASTGQTECVSWLLQSEYKSLYNRTNVSHAMLWAAENGHLGTVQFLLKQGANPRYRHPCGDSALQYASRSGQIDVLKFLIPLVNGETDYPTFFGQFTALHEAASCGQPEAVRTLILDYKADPNATSQIGQTPLMLSVSREDNSNYWKCIQILLKLGAKTDIQDYLGQTVFDLAADKPGCTISLFQYGAFPEFSRNIKAVNRQISVESVHALRFGLVGMLNTASPHECYNVGHVRYYAQTSGPQSKDERFLLAHHLLITMQKSSLVPKKDCKPVFLFWDVSVIQQIAESFRKAPHGGWVSDSYLSMLPQLRRKLRMICSDQLQTVLLKVAEDGQYTIHCSSRQ